MHVMVTGGSGFVGSAVVRQLLGAGHNVRVLVRRSSNLRNLTGLNVDIVHGDLQDPTTFDPALRDCEGLFHVAADYRLWVRNPQQMFAVNVEGTRALIEAAMRAGLRRIVYTSSVATLGVIKNGSASEDSPVAYEDMIGPYKQSKFLAEQAVLRLGDHHAPVVIVNPTTPMGRGDIKPTPTGKIVADAVSGRMPAYVDTGLNIVHVDDVAEGHLLAYERGRTGDRYILGSENLFLADILKEVALLAGRRPPVIRLPHAAVTPIAYVCEAWARLTNQEPMVCSDGVRLARKRMFFSSAKAVEELGYRPRPAREALRDAVAYFSERQEERRPREAVT
jgi:dihydroflavonol-4-reductase